MSRLSHAVGTRCSDRWDEVGTQALAILCHAGQPASSPKDMMTWNQSKKVTAVRLPPDDNRRESTLPVGLAGVSERFAFGPSVDLAKHYPLLLSQSPSLSPRPAKACTGQG